MKTRSDGKIFCFLVCVLLCLTALSSAMAEEGLKPFLRFDLDSADAWQQPLANVRFLTRDTWSLTPIDPQKCEQYGISPDAMPSTEGLDTLNISGSADFSEDQFRQLAQELRAYAGDRPIWVVDYRLESHGLINGITTGPTRACRWRRPRRTRPPASPACPEARSRCISPKTIFRPIRSRSRWSGR